MIFLDPIPHTAPFLRPRRRSLTELVEHRLMAWCDELIPGEPVDIDEWVGADPRHPPHVVVVSFPQLNRAPIMLPLKVDEVVRADLVQALET